MNKKASLLPFILCGWLIAAGVLWLAGCNGDFSETAEYPYYAEIHSYKTPSLVVGLEEGQDFSARLWAWKEGRLSFMEPQGWRVPSRIWFYIEDPYGSRVVDAVRIEGEYQTSFTAEITGDYKLVFDDSEGYCFVRIIYNSPQPLVDVSAKLNE